jgi:hypothetical protein
MRGPGPKWREKHREPAQVPAEEVSLSPMTEVAA